MFVHLDIFSHVQHRSKCFFLLSKAQKTQVEFLVLIIVSVGFIFHQVRFQVFGHVCLLVFLHV